MPIRAEDLRGKDAKLGKQLEKLTVPEQIKKTVVIFYRGLLGKDAKDELIDKVEGSAAETVNNKGAGEE